MSRNLRVSFMMLLVMLVGLSLMVGPAVSQEKMKVGLIIPASATDQGWGQQAADSLMSLESKLGIEVEVAEQAGYGDISPVFLDLVDRGFDLIICHASGYQTVCPELSEQTGVASGIVENIPAVKAGLVGDYESQAQEVAYLAGVLAGLVTKTNVVGVVVSGEPPTWNFMTTGFAEGVHSVNPDARFIYNVIGEAAYEDAAGAKRNTEAQLAAGADVVFGQGDGASFGMMQAISEKKKNDGDQVWFIDVIGDKTSIDTEGVLLSSVLFDFTVVYEPMIRDLQAGDYGKTYTLSVANGGTRLLQFPGAVSAEARAAVAQAEADILSGAVAVSAIADAEAMKARLAELFPGSF